MVEGTLFSQYELRERNACFYWVKNVNVLGITSEFTFQVSSIQKGKCSWMLGVNTEIITVGYGISKGEFGCVLAASIVFFLCKSMTD